MAVVFAPAARAVVSRLSTYDLPFGGCIALEAIGKSLASVTSGQSSSRHTFGSASSSLATSCASLNHFEIHKDGAVSAAEQSHRKAANPAASIRRLADISITA
jgi:hypothetical protein